MYHRFLSALLKQSILLICIAGTHSFPVGFNIITSTASDLSDPNAEVIDESQLQPAFLQNTLSPTLQSPGASTVAVQSDLVNLLSLLASELPSSAPAIARFPTTSQTSVLAGNVASGSSSSEFSLPYISVDPSIGSINDNGVEQDGDATTDNTSAPMSGTVESLDSNKAGQAMPIMSQNGTQAISPPSTVQETPSMAMTLQNSTSVEPSKNLTGVNLDSLLASNSTIQPGFMIVPITAAGVKGIAILPINNSSMFSSKPNGEAPMSSGTPATPVTTAIPSQTTSTSTSTTTTPSQNIALDGNVATPQTSSIPATGNSVASNQSPQSTSNFPSLHPTSPAPSPNNFDDGSKRTVNKTPLGAGLLSTGFASSLESAAINPTGARIDGALPGKPLNSVNPVNTVNTVTISLPSIGNIRVVT